MPSVNQPPNKKPGTWPGFSQHLDVHEREQTNDAGALYLKRDFALVLGTDAGTLARDDLAERRDKALEHVRILVINIGSFVYTEETIAF
jgi:hypothetical protein